MQTNLTHLPGAYEEMTPVQTNPSSLENAETS